MEMRGLREKAKNFQHKFLRSFFKKKETAEKYLGQEVKQGNHSAGLF